MAKLHLSSGNKKLGSVPNISFPPVKTCRPGAPCATDGCYALKFYKMYPSCRNAWDENFEFYQADPEGFWEELNQAFKTTAFFRYFVSGDIPDPEFFLQMVKAAEDNQHCQFLCFTKRFEYVNAYIDMVGKLPENLHIIFSGWEGLAVDNPHNLPQTTVYTDEEQIEDNWLLCGGNCINCICRGLGCWRAVPGDMIAFKKH